MNRLRLAAFAAFALMAPAPAYAALNVFACEPEWAALAQELGGDKVTTYAATSGLQDPHQVQARPSLIARARVADLVVCTGAELEVGWMPVVLRQAGNARIQPGSPGYFDAAGAVRLLDVPNRLDRADGDVHAAGNPHIQTSARNIRAVAVALSRRMQDIDSGDAAAYAKRTEDFLARWDAAMKRWEEAAAPLKGVNVAVSHKNWIYLIVWLGMNEAVALEPKPGIPPGPSYLAQVLADVPRKSIRFILHAAYEDPRPAEFVSQQAGIPIAVLPFTVGGDDQARDLLSLFDDTIARLLAAHAGRG